MRAILFPQWRDSNKERNYPFSDAADLLSVDGKMLPRGVFLDAAIHFPGAEGRHFLQEVTIMGDTLGISIADDAGNAGFGEYRVAGGTDIITLYDSVDRTVGTLVVDQEQAPLLFSLTDSSVGFDPRSTEICATCVSYLPDIGVTGISAAGQLFSGDVWIVGGRGVVLRQMPAPHGALTGAARAEAAAADPFDPRVTTEVRIDMVGDPYDTLTECISNVPEDDPELAAVTPNLFVKSINAGQGNILGLPDQYGNVVIAAASFEAYDNPVRVTPAKNGIRVSVTGRT